MKQNLISLLIALVLITPPITALSAEVIIIKSSDIIPYQKAIEGFKRRFSQGVFQEYSINEDIDKGKSILEYALKKGGDLILAVGPEAAYLVGIHSSSVPKVFTMVLNPEKLLDDTTLYHGVSLNLPIDFQLERIKMAFPKRRRVGILYTQEQNQKIVDSISRKAVDSDLHIVSLPIASQKDIPRVFNSPQFNVDILWIIPDRTIGSEKIIKYLIKRMLLKKIPVVGFNEWFTDNGAILSFYLDDQEIGEQTAELAQKLLLKVNSLTSVIHEPLSLRTIVNLKVAGKLGISVSNDLITKASEVIK